MGIAALAAVVIVLDPEVGSDKSKRHKKSAAAHRVVRTPKRPASREQPPASLPQNPDDLPGTDSRALTRAVNLRRALVLLDRRRTDREGIFDDLRLAPGRIDTSVKTARETLDLQMRADFSVPFAHESVFPNDSDPHFRSKGLSARAVDPAVPERMLRAIDRHRAGSAARDIDYFVISRDIIDRQVRYGAYLKRGAAPPDRASRARAAASRRVIAAPGAILAPMPGPITAVIRAETTTHRHLRDRLTRLAAVTAAADAVGTLLMWLFERNAGSDIKDLWDAFFFSTTQLLTVSSNTAGPFSAGGRIVDIALEALAITVVTAVAGSFGAFFHRRSQERDPLPRAEAAGGTDTR